MDLPLRIPEVVAVIEESRGPALVETAVFGLPLDLWAGRQTRARPWEVVARVAAAVHSVDTSAFLTAGGEALPGHPTRRAHAEDSLKVFDDLSDIDEPEVRDAHLWAREHLPAEAPARLAHGDLLGQNILLSFAEAPPALIDWENAQLGDPAYDLSIVTRRGLRRPFGMARRLHRLLRVRRRRDHAG